MLRSKNMIKENGIYKWKNNDIDPYKKIMP
jgi:hypothetical protein